LKVISTPDYTTWTYQFTCSACKSKLSADHTDLKYRVEKKWQSDSYGDGGDYQAFDHYYVICPACGGETAISVKQPGAEIPLLLQKKVKKNY
jgi:hypothetical protein